MAKAFDFKKMRTFIKIYGVVQVVLIGLLVFMAIHFQVVLQARFFLSVIVTLAIQLALFYPINRFAAKEAEREVETSVIGLSAEELKALRSKRMLADAIKWAVLIFFITFLLRAPNHPLFMSMIYFSFIVTMLTYFQCYNFSAKRLMKEKS
jgi:hypothetical protein